MKRQRDRDEERRLLLALGYPPERLDEELRRLDNLSREQLLLLEEALSAFREACRQADIGVACLQLHFTLKRGARLH